MGRVWGDWDVLRLPAFRAVWLADFASNVGLFAQAVGAGWLMTSLTTDAHLIALVQTASSLPLFLFAIPAGVLADLVDRRRLIRSANIALAILAAALAALTWSGHIAPVTLLAATFALGLVGALQAPAWGALIPEIVAPENLAPAVGLNAVNYNLSRVIGPPLAGVLVAAAGPAIAFAVNAISFVPTALVMRPRAGGAPLAAAAFRAGFATTVALARSSAAVQNVLVRNATFGICGSVIFSLLPLLARVDLHASPAQFGLLYGALGCGSVAVAQVLGRIRDALGVGGAIFSGTLVLGCCVIGLGLTTSLPLAFALLFVAGFGWLTVLSSLNTAIQFAVPPERRASGFALYLVTSQGVMAVGAIAWGAFAAAFGAGPTFVAAGALFVLLGLVTRRVPVPWAGIPLAP